jgi:hypothetical protein
MGNGSGSSQKSALCRVIMFVEICHTVIAKVDGAGVFARQPGASPGSGVDRARAAVVKVLALTFDGPGAG